MLDPKSRRSLVHGVEQGTRKFPLLKELETLERDPSRRLFLQPVVGGAVEMAVDAIDG